MPQMALLRNRFRLTPAEARLVLRLVTGDSLQSAAKALGVKYGTVRTHLKTVFQKTGTRRQAELVIVIMRALDELG
jgi:DNA-binding CsgD family transcriptional regulator